MIEKYFQLAQPLLALFETFLRLTGNPVAITIADQTEKYVTAVKAGLSAMPKNESTVYKDLDGITEYGELVLTQINAIKTSDLDKAQKIAEATRLAATLSDKKIVFQPKKGDDFRALNDYKARALNLVNEIAR